MKLLFVSCLCSDGKFKKIYNNSEQKPSQTAQKYLQLMLEGFLKNDSIQADVLTALPINRLITRQFYFKGEKENDGRVNYNYLSFVNLPILRHLFIYFYGLRYCLFWCLNNKDGLIICDALGITLSMACLLASKITKHKCVGIVTDVPSITADISMRKMNFFEKIIIYVNTFFINYFDAYLFLTKNMNDLINKKGKPYVIIEGHVDVDMTNTLNTIDNKHKKQICIYAGTLKRVYGLQMLVEAFITANLSEAELHIYGSGDYEEELKIICQHHPNVKYFGVVPNDIVVQEQLKATLLVNPRPTNEEYTKYSFPSKNMEYMVSGTPVLTTRLPGMPEEYEQYVYLIEDESVEGLEQALKTILAKPAEELHQKGMEAKEFVLQNKNNVVQARKVIEMALGQMINSH